MTDEELKELVASLTVSQKETDKKLQKLGEINAETSRQVNKMSKSIKELGKQIGGLGNKFGSFTEGMAFPAMEKLLREKFKMDVIAPNIRVTKNGRKMELDVLSYSNSGLNKVVIVEVKSHLDEREWEQIQTIIREFFDFFPSHKGKKLYCIVAAVDFKEEIAKKVIENGIYLAKLTDELFELKIPRNFIPRAFE
jgi:hypothetical protein